MELRPYLFFNGRSKEAIDYYKTALGAEVELLMHFKDAPPGPQSPPPEMGDLVMHATLKVGGAVLFLSDGMSPGHAHFEGFSLSIGAPDEASVDRFCAALSKDGTVRQTPTPTFFARRFAMVTDKFGVGWMILCEA